MTIGLLVLALMLLVLSFLGILVAGEEESAAVGIPVLIVAALFLMGAVACVVGAIT